MPDSNSTYRIEIVVGSDTSGAKEVSQGLNEFTATAAKATAETEKLKLQQEGLKNLAKTLGSEISPELGEALSGALEGPAGTVTIVCAGIELLGKKIAEAKAEVEKLRTEMSQLETDIWTAQRDALNDASDAAHKYHAALNEIPSVLDSIKAKQSEQLALLQEQITAQQELLDHQKQLELSKASTPGERAEIESRFDTRKTDARLGGEETVIQTLETQKAALGRTHDELKRQAGIDESRRESALANSKTAADKAVKSAAVKKESELNAAVKKAKDELGWGGDLEQAKFALASLEHPKKPTGPRARAGDRLLADDLSERIKTLENALRAQKDNQSAVAELNKTLQTAKHDLYDAGVKADASLAALKNSEAEIAKLDERIRTEKASLQVHSRTAQAISVMDQSKPGFVQSTVGSAIKAIVDQNRGKITEADQHALEDLGNLLKTVNMNFDRIIKTINSSADLHREQTDLIKAIDMRLEAMRREIVNRPPATGSTAVHQ